MKLSDLPMGRYFDGTYEWDFDGADWYPISAPGGMPSEPDIKDLQKVIVLYVPLNHKSETPEEIADRIYGQVSIGGYNGLSDNTKRIARGAALQAARAARGLPEREPWKYPEANRG